LTESIFDVITFILKFKVSEKIRGAQETMKHLVTKDTLLKTLGGDWTGTRKKGGKKGGAGGGGDKEGGDKESGSGEEGKEDAEAEDVGKAVHNQYMVMIATVVKEWETHSLVWPVAAEWHSVRELW